MATLASIFSASMWRFFQVSALPVDDFVTSRTPPPSLTRCYRWSVSDVRPGFGCSGYLVSFIALWASCRHVTGFTDDGRVRQSTIVRLADNARRFAIVLVLAGVRFQTGLTEIIAAEKTSNRRNGIEMVVVDEVEKNLGSFGVVVGSHSDESVP